MSVICDDIPNTEAVKKALFEEVPSLVSVKYVGESKIPGIDATKLSPCVLPVFYKKFADEIEAFKVYKDDVWVTSFPKCGTTWTQEMVWLIVNNLDFANAKKNDIIQRYIFIERPAITRQLFYTIDKNTVEIAQTLPRPRFIKSHLPIDLLPSDFWTVKPKLVYVARNPKDTAISFYHHYVNVFQYKGTLEDFLDTFLNDLVCWSPFRDHIINYWRLRNEPNILFITYEDMFKDLRKVLEKVANFFNKTYTDDQFNQLANHLSFNEMKKNEAVNHDQVLRRNEKFYGRKQSDPSYRFLRRGELNSAKDEMSEEYQRKFDDWLAEAFKGCGFKFNV